jgi:hypothetical protein
MITLLISIIIGLVLINLFPNAAAILILALTASLTYIVLGDVFAANPELLEAIIIMIVTFGLIGLVAYIVVKVF